MSEVILELLSLGRSRTNINPEVRRPFSGLLKSSPFISGTEQSLTTVFIIHTLHQLHFLKCPCRNLFFLLVHVCVYTKEHFSLGLTCTMYVIVKCICVCTCVLVDAMKLEECYIRGNCNIFSSKYSNRRSMYIVPCVLHNFSSCLPYRPLHLSSA